MRLLALFIALLFISESAYADCSSPGGPEGALAYFSADKTYKFCDGTYWVWMRGNAVPDYDSGWVVAGAPNSVTTLTHGLGTKDFSNIQILGSCGSDETKPLFVGGVSSSGTGAYGNDLVFDTVNTVKVELYLHGGMSGAQCGAAAKFRVKLWK